MILTYDEYNNDWVAINEEGNKKPFLCNFGLRELGWDISAYDGDRYDFTAQLNPAPNSIPVSIIRSYDGWRWLDGDDRRFLYGPAIRALNKLAIKGNEAVIYLVITPCQ